MAMAPVADRYLSSWWSRRRAIAVRTLGLLRIEARTAQVIAALDDPHPDVRAAALDALRDLRNRDALRAIVIRLTDASLHAERRAAALAAFGGDCEQLVLELAELDVAQRADYARALKCCGTARSRAALRDWTFDARPAVQAAALDALARVGLDDGCARRALECLEHDDPQVRAMAAHALRGWSGSSFTASQLARHLDDVWTVAVRSAVSLRSMRPHGLDALRVRAQREGVAGILARQMLWEEQVRV
jgi:HEAT repeat protein